VVDALLGDGEVDVGGEVGDVIDGGLKAGAVDGGAGVAVHAVPANGVKVGVVGFVRVVDPAIGGSDVACGVDGDAVGFEVVEDVLVGPIAKQEEGGGLAGGGVDVAGEWDVAFDEVCIRGFVAVENGVPREVEMTGGALEEVFEAAEVAAGGEFGFGGSFGAETHGGGLGGTDLVLFDGVEAEVSCSGVGSAGDGDGERRVVVDFEVPVGDEAVGIGVAVAEAGFSPLDAGEADSEMVDEDVEEDGAVLAAGP
jgi:hypothetical protein